jgi:hypothetical protein
MSILTLCCPFPIPPTTSEPRLILDAISSAGELQFRSSKELGNSKVVKKDGGRVSDIQPCPVMEPGLLGELCGSGKARDEVSWIKVPFMFVLFSS